MKIKELFNTGKTIFSFEFFPPKTEKGEENLLKAIEELKKLSPHFVSVTYGALGTTQDKSLTPVLVRPRRKSIHFYKVLRRSVLKTF